MPGVRPRRLPAALLSARPRQRTRPAPSFPPPPPEHSEPPDEGTRDRARVALLPPASLSIRSSRLIEVSAFPSSLRPNDSHRMCGYRDSPFVARVLLLRHDEFPLLKTTRLSVTNSTCGLAAFPGKAWRLFASVFQGHPPAFHPFGKTQRHTQSRSYLKLFETASRVRMTKDACF